jgi:hypothetical protein
MIVAGVNNGVFDCSRLQSVDSIIPHPATVDDALTRVEN